MKFWVILICLLRGKIEAEAEMIDKKIMDLALDPFCESLTQCEKISKLSNEKISLINLKILYDRIQRIIGNEGVEKIRLLRSKPFLKQYCEKNRISLKDTVDEALAVAQLGVSALEKLSFTASKLDEDFGDIYRIAYELHRIKGLVKYANAYLKNHKKEQEKENYSLCG